VHILQLARVRSYCAQGRFAFWGFLIVAAFWIGDLFYERPTFSGWYDWLRLGGFLFFPAMTIRLRNKYADHDHDKIHDFGN
jgi:hypothetical protein